MAKRKTAHDTSPAKASPSAGTVLWDGVKLGLEEAADLASLRLKAVSLERRRDSLYTKLGKVTYQKLHPTTGTVRSELDEQSATLSREIHDVISELSDIRLKMKLRKAGIGK